MEQGVEGRRCGVYVFAFLRIACTISRLRRASAWFGSKCLAPLHTGQSLRRMPQCGANVLPRLEVRPAWVRFDSQRLLRTGPRLFIRHCATCRAFPNRSRHRQDRDTHDVLRLDFHRRLEMLNGIAKSPCLSNSPPRLLVGSVVLRGAEQGEAPEGYAVAPIRGLLVRSPSAPQSPATQPRRTPKRDAATNKQFAALPSLWRSTARSAAGTCSGRPSRAGRFAPDRSPARAFPSTRTSRPTDKGYVANGSTRQP